MDKVVALCEEACGKVEIAPDAACAIVASSHTGAVLLQDLARALSLNSMQATRLVDRLERQGLVIRAVPNADRRSIELNLTDRGWQVYEALASSFSNASACQTVFAAYMELRAQQRSDARNLGLTLQQVRVLRALGSEPMTVSTVALRSGVKRTSVHMALKALVRTGFAEELIQEGGPARYRSLSDRAPVANGEV